MNEPDSHTDHDLVAAFNRDGSEAAFQALVSRHADLVFATALRQVGDPGVAEEVTQNVFVALARKARGLSRAGTVAGWLHRAALLEARSRIRADLRRQRREASAVELTMVAREGTSPLAWHPSCLCDR